MIRIIFSCIIALCCFSDLLSQNDTIDYSRYTAPSFFYLEINEPDILDACIDAKRIARKNKEDWNYKEWYVNNYILQDTTNVVSNSPTARLDIKPYVPIYMSPGDELKIAANHFYSGVGIQVSGAAVLLISSAVNAKRLIEQTEPAMFRDVETSQKTFNFISGALILVGTIYQFESFSHINGAGLLLNENGIGVKININTK